MRRRDVLRLAGGGVVVAAGVAGAGYATGFFDPYPESALAPWRSAGRATDPRIAALSYAILSPNPHNRQPWLARLDGTDAITLFCDPTRLLPETDPLSRQILIGLGGFCETLQVAATMTGHAAEVEPFPEGPWPDDAIDRRPVARIVLRPGAARDPLAAHIVHRRSVKAAFDRSREVSTGLVDQVVAASAVHGVTSIVVRDEARLAPLRALLFDAMELEIRTPAKWRESVDLVRVGGREIAANPDGVTLGGPFFEVMRLTGSMSVEAMTTPGSMAFRSAIDRYRPMTETTPLVLYQRTEDNGRAAQFAAGRAYARVALTVTSLGLSLHPMSQLLQEYVEMRPLQRRFLDLVGEAAPRQVQMLARLGYARPASPTPRWPVETRLIT